MANETTSGGLTEIVNSEVIADIIIQYAIDATVIAPLTRIKDLSGGASQTASFPQWELDAVSTVTTEGTTSLSNVQLQTTEVAAISVSEVGILREVTKMASRSNTLGEAGLMQFVVEDGGRLCIVDLENSLASRFSGFTNSVGATGTDLSVANFVQAISTMGTVNARGRVVSVLDDQQAFDLRAAVAASTGAVFGGGNVDQSILQPGDSGYVGSLFNVPIWMTNLTDTANTGADVVGAMFIDGQTNPEFAGLGAAILWYPEVQMTQLPDQSATQLAITMAYGTGRISDFGVDLTTDA